MTEIFDRLKWKEVQKAYRVEQPYSNDYSLMLTKDDLAEPDVEFDGTPVGAVFARE